MTRDEAAEFLLEVEDRAYDYHINEKVLGFPVNEFEDKMHKAAYLLGFMPRKVKHITQFTRVQKGFCPTCEMPISDTKNGRTKFCQYCGQRVIWNDEG